MKPETIKKRAIEGALWDLGGYDFMVIDLALEEAQKELASEKAQGKLSINQPTPEAIKRIRDKVEALRKAVTL